ncbi:MAG: MarR family winged helix-turn-helix transcriptional regulator [Marinobacter sp.]|uniref:MarR family winged helix-turn-helix transcriptional regulator n=1 Tax=Marinobacter sp. TaxID=50741 RepID=UPI003C61C7B3
MTAPEDGLALDSQVCFALYTANRAVVARYRPLLAELGLTYPQYLVMLVLWEAAADDHRLKVSEVGERLRLDSGTLTPLLKRLELQGLVNRARGADDERVVTVAVTQAGYDLREQARSVPERLLCATGVAPERLMALRDELRSVLAELERQAPNVR